VNSEPNPPPPTPSRRRRKSLAELERDIAEQVDTLRETLRGMETLLDGELTAADYARLGGLWVRLAEVALHSDRHRKAEAERKARLAQERNGKKPALSGEVMDNLEGQMRLL
jgi:hypothetical protein